MFEGITQEWVIGISAPVVLSLIGFGIQHRNRFVDQRDKEVDKRLDGFVTNYLSIGHQLTGKVNVKYPFPTDARLGLEGIIGLYHFARIANKDSIKTKKELDSVIKKIKYRGHKCPFDHFHFEEIEDLYKEFVETTFSERRGKKQEFEDKYTKYHKEYKRQARIWHKRQGKTGK